MADGNPKKRPPQMKIPTPSGGGGGSGYGRSGSGSGGSGGGDYPAPKNGDGGGCGAAHSIPYAVVAGQGLLPSLQASQMELVNARATIGELTQDIATARGQARHERALREAAEGQRAQSDAQLGELIYDYGLITEGNIHLTVALHEANAALLARQQEQLQTVQDVYFLQAGQEQLEYAAVTAERAADNWQILYSHERRKTGHLKETFGHDVLAVAKSLACRSCRKITGTVLYCGGDECDVGLHICSQCFHWAQHWRLQGGEWRTAEFKAALARIPGGQWDVDHMRVDNVVGCFETLHKIVDEEAKAGGTYFKARLPDTDWAEGEVCSCGVLRVVVKSVQVYDETEMAALLADNLAIEPNCRPIYITGDTAYLATNFA